jgi:hypothetical protein
MKEITQYHVDQVQKQDPKAKSPTTTNGKSEYESIVTSEFSLGKWKLEKDWHLHVDEDNSKLKRFFYLNNASNPETSFLRAIYTDGSKCDLTNTPRETEVVFRCNEEISGAKMIGISEISTCKYQLDIQTKYLCSHPMFQAVQVETLQIKCAPFVTESANQNTKVKEKEISEQNKNDESAKDEL